MCPRLLILNSKFKVLEAVYLYNVVFFLFIVLNFLSLFGWIEAYLDIPVEIKVHEAYEIR